jgi:hypothetical protein
MLHHLARLALSALLTAVVLLFVIAPAFAYWPLL